MKRFIVNILVFFLIIAFIDFTVGKLGDYLQTHAKGGNTRIINDLVMKDYHDIIILGSSRARHHYDAPFLSDSLGLDVYNAGVNGNGVILSYGLLEMLLERYSPKLIIFDVEPAFDIYVYQPDDCHRRYLRWLKPYYKNPVVGSIIRDVSKEEWYKTRFGMLRYNTLIIYQLKDLFTETPSKNKGYQPLNGVYLGEPKKDTTILEQDSFKLQYVENIIQLAQNKNVPFAIVASPKFGRDDSSELQPVKDICKLFNVPFIDYYADSIFKHHKVWFKEPMHLNHDGARVYSKCIIKEIKQQIK